MEFSPTSLEAPFASELREDESVLWSGQPDASKIFTSSDVAMIPFSLMWGGFAIFWEASVLGFGWTSGHRAPAIFGLWGIPFVVVGLYMMFGRFFYRAWIRRRTWYVVTSRRAIIVRQGTSRTVITVPVSALGSLTWRGATLTFGAVRDAGYDASGMGMFGRGRAGPAPMAFEDIPDAQATQRLIEDLQQGASR